jgi:hypothetical protein
MVTIFYNSKKFTRTLIYLQQAVNTSPFDLYIKLSDFWRREGMDNIPHGKMRIYRAMYDFAKEYMERNILKDLLRQDLLLNGDEKYLPDWLKYL